MTTFHHLQDVMTRDSKCCVKSGVVGRPLVLHGLWSTGLGPKAMSSFLVGLNVTLLGSLQSL